LLLSGYDNRTDGQTTDRQIDIGNIARQASQPASNKLAVP